MAESLPSMSEALDLVSSNKNVSALRRQKQADLCVSKASPVYTADSRTARTR